MKVHRVHRCNPFESSHSSEHNGSFETTTLEFHMAVMMFISSFLRDCVFFVTRCWTEGSMLRTLVGFDKQHKDQNPSFKAKQMHYWNDLWLTSHKKYQWVTIHTSTIPGNSSFNIHLKNMLVQIGSFSQGSGWNLKTYLSCHHLVKTWWPSTNFYTSWNEATASFAKLHLPTIPFQRDETFRYVSCRQGTPLKTTPLKINMNHGSGWKIMFLCKKWVIYL